MTVGKETMGEQPIFTCKAHVFHIDPKTKRSWMSASSAAVSVSFFYDSSRNLYRIISVEGTKAVINSTITANMTFTKTSQKFGQWSDVRANTVYGLGFASESELGKSMKNVMKVSEAKEVCRDRSKYRSVISAYRCGNQASFYFIEKFQEVKEAIQAQACGGTGPTAGPTPASGATPVPSASASPLLAARPAPHDDEPPQPQPKIENEEVPHPRSHSVPLSSTGNIQSGYATVGRGPRAPPADVPGAGAGAGGGAGGDSPEQQLRYENDRLKLALAQSSANAKKWEVELATLKSNNLRLTGALQESTANVDEWKRQLHQYREEVARARHLAGKGGEASEVEQLRQRAAQLEAELAQKNEELAQITKSRKSEQDAEAKLAQSQLELALAAQEGQKQVISALNDQLARQLEELSIIHRELSTALQT